MKKRIAEMLKSSDVEIRKLGLAYLDQEKSHSHARVKCIYVDGSERFHPCYVIILVIDL